ncbi:hypothetical protein [Burkholderia phage BCSR5]|nr:hypothetical protein [Burkholderia phage BCSR5]
MTYEERQQQIEEAFRLIRNKTRFIPIEAFEEGMWYWFHTYVERKGKIEPRLMPGQATMFKGQQCVRHSFKQDPTPVAKLRVVGGRKVGLFGSLIMEARMMERDGEPQRALEIWEEAMKTMSPDEIAEREIHAQQYSRKPAWRPALAPPAPDYSAQAKARWEANRKRSEEALKEIYVSHADRNQSMLDRLLGLFGLQRIAKEQ